jgi:hypothetical protein
MRVPILALLLGGVVCHGQTTDTLACVVRLEMPVYPILARQAWVEGSAKASFTVREDGGPAKLVVVATHELLRQMVESRVAKSKFRPDCAGASLTLRVSFKLHPPRRKFGLDEITLVAPDTVEVTTTQPDETPQTASKKP